MGKTPLGTPGSHRAVQTLLRFRAVAHALNIMFVYVSSCALKEWEGGGRWQIIQCYSTSYMNKQRLQYLGVSNYKSHLGMGWDLGFLFLQSGPVQSIIYCFISTVHIIEVNIWDPWIYLPSAHKK